MSSAALRAFPAGGGKPGALLALMVACTPRAIAAATIPTRRTALRLATTAAVGLALPRHAAFAAEEATATFSAGDPRFLQPVFDDIKYLGIRRCEIGRLGGTPAIRVAYDPSKVSFKRIVGAFWRSCDPTSKDQFGDSTPAVVWAAGDAELKAAEESRRRLQLSTEYRSSTFGPMYRGRPVLAEVRPLAGVWEPSAHEDQGWYKAEPKAYERARKKSGRAKWFEDAYKPVTVTACQKEKGEGTLCGFVYFPCNEENGCSFVTKGAF